MKASHIIKFPDKSFKTISHQFEDLISQVNHHISDDKYGDKDLAIELLYELVWGTLDYLKFEATTFFDKGQMIKDFPNIKSYLNQLMNLMTVIEEISLINSSLANDRYVLYYKDILGTFAYLGVDFLHFISDFIISLSNLSTLKYSSKIYVSDFSSFLVEMGVLAYETTNLTIAQSLLELGIKVIDKIGKYDSFDIIKVYLSLGVIYENKRMHNQAANTYKKTFKVFETLNHGFNNPVIDQYIVHEIGIFGYINSILVQNEDLMEEFFNFRTKYFEPEESMLIGDLHANYFLGITDTTKLPYLGNQFDKFRSSVPSFILSGKSNRLYHINSVSYLAELTQIIRISTDRPSGLVVFEADSYKDIDIQIGKEHLASIQVIPKPDGKIEIELLGKRINISSAFCWATTFQKNTEAVLHYNKKNYKIKLELKEVPPTILCINITKEIEESHKIKEGKAVKFYNELWSKDMSILDIMKNISKISSDMFFFEDIEELGRVFKKTNQKDAYQVIKNLTGKDAIPLEGQALQLVILQRLSELTENTNEAMNILSSIINK
ncbi:MAG: hypothetical protein HeimC3_44520 [Candidatus Heimdallarchaeota archaeon LC_3]|nr:MAG: hypothetical protein HeimC3_44520 [Candidatus Heimdallarchaeota archaeon LC_3]